MHSALQTQIAQATNDKEQTFGGTSTQQGEPILLWQAHI